MVWIKICRRAVAEPAFRLTRVCQSTRQCHPGALAVGGAGWHLYRREPRGSGTGSANRPSLGWPTGPGTHVLGIQRLIAGSVRASGTTPVVGSFNATEFWVKMSRQ